MSKRVYGRTASGKPITDELVEQLADEAEAERRYDVEEPVARRGRRGRPRLCSKPFAFARRFRGRGSRLTL